MNIKIMKRRFKFSLALILLTFGISFAQLNTVKSELERTKIREKDTLDGWKNFGQVNLLLNQSAFSNWVAGGENSIAGNLNAQYNFYYKKGSWTWDNLLQGSYGLSSTESKGLRKTDDRLEINSILGEKAFENWSYSLFMNFKTQFVNGYHYDLDEDRGFRTSGLFKPAYLTFGPGLLWRKSQNFHFNLAPLTSKVTFLSGEVFTYTDLDGDGKKEAVSSNVIETYGVDPGKSYRYELGFYAAGYYKASLMENITMENILSLYSNYLENPKNVDLDYTMNLIFKINKYLSTNLSVQTIYDDDAFSGFQIREVFGLGINVNL